MYLYFGYLFIQIFSLIEKLWNTNMSVIAVFFSLVVFFIWSVIPLVGYLLTKFFGNANSLSKPILFIAGITGALIEQALYYFDILYYNQLYMGTFIVFCCFFVVGLFCHTRMLNAIGGVKQHV